MDSQLQAQLRKAYDASATDRQNQPESEWKTKERQEFLNLLQAEGKQNLLEIGAGPGKASQFFKDHGLKVIATDLSSEMIRLCIEKGLEAYVMDFFNLQFPDNHFDAVYALNCLLHVPEEELPRALLEINRLLKPSGLFFLGVYGGFDQQGVWQEDNHEPKRFFAFYRDEKLIRLVENIFSVLDFKRLSLPGINHPHMVFQRLILRKE